MSETDRWLEFAGDDLRSAELLAGAGIFHLACFHCQQAAEKILKGFLLARKRNYPRTHSLPDLLQLCAKLDSDFMSLERACISLDRFYVPTRYPDAAAGTLPGGLPDRNDAEEAVAQVGEILAFVMRLLPKR